MKKALIFLIDIYQKIFSSFLKNILGVSHFCRFRPSCSEYAKISIQQKGVLLGSLLAITRILKCQPFYKRGENLVMTNKL